ncbi:hypothetical protein HK097_000660 [Rhizophlyctis rosea]|uniref:Beta-catenin-like protein 1 N-terminal domain-containing protein n=1 Tax=Rhizophlyctis rosea TaxID=64517 RepID=A0AAD5S7M1_9FUNG|nr:hypothetical protein HK097_000660 [Rhizophlyctis rosea]
MNIDSIFKVPPVPVGKHKRKLPDDPSEAQLKKLRPSNGEDDEDYRSGWGPSSSNGSGPADSQEDLVDEEEDGRFHGSGLSEEQQRIYDIVDAGEEAPASIDLPTLKKMVLKFERAINKNQELRVKFSDDPMKFIDSEADLDDEIKSMTTASASPELYNTLVELGVHDSILSLLTHENTDIAIAAVGLIDELTDEEVLGDTSEDGEEGMKALVKALVDGGVLEMLVQNLTRINEFEGQGDDKQGVFSTLSVIENFQSVDPTHAETVVSKTNILPWLLQRVRVKQFDSNRQYASELLAILLQNSRANRLKLGEVDGVDALLQVTASYKRKDPKDADEIELMENLFDALCSALAEPEVKKLFLEGEGLELMLIMVKEKKMSRMRALKVIDHALMGAESAALCAYFVENMGLRTLFPVFMRKGIRQFRKEYKTYSEAEEDEHVISILSSLLRNLTNQLHRARLVSKFLENDCEKVNRLIDMHQHYFTRVAAVDAEIEKRKKEREEERNGEEVDEEEEALDREEDYLSRLDGGLFTLQLVDFVVGYCCVEDESGTVKNRVLEALSQRNRSVDEVKETLTEYANNIGGGDQEADKQGQSEGGEDTVSVREIILAIVDRL